MKAVVAHALNELSVADVGLDPPKAAALVGCGGVGLAIVQGARIAGARQVIAVERGVNARGVIVYD